MNRDQLSQRFVRYFPWFSEQRRDTGAKLQHFTQLEFLALFCLAEYVTGFDGTPRTQVLEYSASVFTCRNYFSI